MCSASIRKYERIKNGLFVKQRVPHNDSSATHAYHCSVQGAAHFRSVCAYGVYKMKGGPRSSHYFAFSKNIVGNFCVWRWKYYI